MTKMTGAQAIIEALKKEKVNHIFGISGGAVLPIYDVLYDAEMRNILAKHEQCAGHMADGYARVSGLPGVCIATSGPGATNLVTGIANAYMDSSPVVSITGQVTRAAIGKDAFQEADIVGITTPITKYVTQVKRTEDIPKVFKTAFYIATSGRPGPVLVDVPKDIQQHSTDFEFHDSITLRGYKPRDNPHPVQVKRAAEMLVKAEHPMILAGGGVIISNASRDLLKLAELMMLPVATTLMGKGSIPETHPLSLGMVGMHGMAQANTLILESDVLLTVGARFSDRTTARVDGFCPDTQIIHIDIDSAEIGKNVKIDLPIVADAGKTLRAIYKLVVKKAMTNEKSPWHSRIQQVREHYTSELERDSQSITAPAIIRSLRALLPNNAIIATEVGQNQMWAALHFQSLEPRTFLSSGGLGTMGFGFPAAIGAKVAKPDVPVVDIAGDGSFIMSAQELATSVLEEIPVIVVVLNNSMLGMVAQWQRIFYNRRYSGTMLHDSPDFVKLAEAFGAQGIRIGSLDEFSQAVKNGLTSDVTTVIDVPISPEENVYPMIPSGKTLKDMILGA
ncbi:MAG: biosynthetic-type acetolactate synthase large subunit [Candidatus Bathyarchaeota archaeon]|nr:biosynthetic-type acetolactate synthase large subunit [Candidatus Bathyarchaeota archaeon]